MQHMKLQSEDDILDPNFRARIIKEIEGTENKRRRTEALKRYEVLKDQTDIYVNVLLSKQFDETTVSEMQYAITNVSFTRKIVNKLARVYNNGVKRTIGKRKGDTKKIEVLADKLELNQAMKKANRYLRLFKNTLVFVEPIKRVLISEDGQESEKWTLKIRPLPPFMYDVIPDPNDEEQPLVVVLSDFSPLRGETFSLDPASHLKFQPGLPYMDVINHGRLGDNRKQTIADDPRDVGHETKKDYFWWSPKYNFKTGYQGEITGGPEDQKNPINILPFINLADDQDGNYWALGGADLADGGIKINALLTHTNHVSVTQGYGQFVVKGAKGTLPQHFKLGPNHALLLEHDPNNNEPAGDAQFINSGAPISDLLSTIEMYIALLLSTNNLSTSGFASNLQGGLDAASGIALIIDKAESIEDVSEQQQVFLDSEPLIWVVIKRWFDFYKNKDLLIPSLQKETMPKDVDDLMINFADPQPIISEKDKLEVLKMRQEMGINRMVEILMKDDPSLTEESAEEKLKKILEEKMQRKQEMINRAQENGGNNQDQGDEKRNQFNNRSDIEPGSQSEDEESDSEGSGRPAGGKNPVGGSSREEPDQG